MLVGAGPNRPSASYKLNTLVSNRTRETTSGKTGQPRGRRAPTREAIEAVGGTRVLELGKTGLNPGPTALSAGCVTLVKPPDLSESASPSREQVQSPVPRATVSVEEMKATRS